MIKSIKVLKEKKYMLIFIASTLLMLVTYPYLQVLRQGGFSNYFYWFQMLWKISPINFILYIIFSILFGVVISLVIHNWKDSKVCNIRGSSSGGISSLLALSVSQCSTCLPFASLFLPATAVGFISVNNTLINFIIVGLLIYSIYSMGGFNNQDNGNTKIRKKR